MAKAKEDKDNTKNDNNNRKQTTKKSSGGKFTKGHAKVGGRKKGTSNQVTADIRKIIEEQLRPHINSIGKTISEIKDPAQKSAAIAQWNQYLVPKFSNTTINADTKRDISTEEYIQQLNGHYDPDDIDINIANINIINNG